MKGHRVEFPVNGTPGSGYFSPSGTGSGPGIIVIQEWWGLVGHIKDVADRFATAGFNALVPDFYNGKSTTEPDEAGSMMMALQIEEVAKLVRGSVDFLLDGSREGDKVGVVGFCMGGQLSMYAACVDPRIGACVNFYGIHPHVYPDFAKINGPLLGFFAEDDEYNPLESVAALDKKLTELGKEHSITVFEGTQHAFFNSDRPEVYNHEVAEMCWEQMIAFFRANL